MFLNQRVAISKLLVHQGFRKYLANTSWLFAEQILRIIAGLLVGIYVARYLGPEKFGLFSYALAFVAIFSSVAKFGLDGIVVRDLVNAPGKCDLYLGTAFWLKVLGALLAGGLVAAAVIVAESDDTTKLYIGIIASGLIFQSFEVVDFYFQSRVLSKYVSICKITQLVISSLLKLYFVAINADLFWFVLVSVIDQASLAVALYYAYLRLKIGSFILRFNKAVASELIASAKPLIIAGLIVSVYSSIDRILIKEMMGAREVGLYAAATGLVTALYFIPMLIANSLFPAILNAKRQSTDVYITRLALLYRFILVIGVLVCIFITIFAEPIIHALYGVRYMAAAGVLQIYVWNFTVICFSAIFGKWLLSENLQHISLSFNVMAMVVNVIGCLFFIPLWSIKGAAFAALASQFIPLAWYGITNKEIKSQIKSVFN